MAARASTKQGQNEQVDISVKKITVIKHPVWLLLFGLFSRGQCRKLPLLDFLDKKIMNPGSNLDLMQEDKQLGFPGMSEQTAECLYAHRYWPNYESAQPPR